MKMTAGARALIRQWGMTDVEAIVSDALLNALTGDQLAIQFCVDICNASAILEDLCQKRMLQPSDFILPEKLKFRKDQQMEVAGQT